MNIGQTSIVHFGSRLLASGFGFASTVYFARLLGPEPVGIYYLVISLVSWLGMIGTVGLSAAMTKRISEGEDKGEFIIAGSTLIGSFSIIISLCVLFYRPQVNNYLDYPGTGYLLAILFVTLTYSVLNSILNGFRLVHITGPLSSLRVGLRSVLQIGALTLGYELAGLFVGHMLAFVFALFVGVLVLFRHLNVDEIPEQRHFRSLIDYAKFAWVGNLQSKMFNHTDIIILGFFVPSTLIGIYSIAWNIGQFLILFAGSLSTTLFPEMSRLAVDQDLESVESLVEDAIAYAGLLMIPGLTGAAILGERILRIYGPEFTQGAAVLTVLIAASLIMSYQRQLVNTLNALNRPELSFRVNAGFVVSNVSLNVVLIQLYGWLGAAVATMCSALIGAALSYYYLESVIDIVIPADEIGRQSIAALVMGSIIYVSVCVENTYGMIDNNAAVLLVLIGGGAGIYFILLFTISNRFRAAVRDNLPSDILMI